MIFFSLTAGLLRGWQQKDGKELTSIDSTSEHGTDYKSCDSLDGINTRTVLEKSELLTVMRG